MKMMGNVKKIKKTSKLVKDFLETPIAPSGSNHKKVNTKEVIKQASEVAKKIKSNN